MKHLIRAAVLAALSLCAFAAPAAAQDNFAVKDATATTITKSARKLSDGSLADKNVMVDMSGVEKGTAANPWLITFPTAPTVNIGTMPSVTIASSALPAGAATAAGQAANTNAITGAQAAAGSNAATPFGVQGVAGGQAIDTVLKAAEVDRGASVGTTATVLMAINAARRGFSIQVQSTSASCYLNGQGTATADYHSLQIGPGGYKETSPEHVATTAISIICTAASTPVYAREW